MRHYLKLRSLTVDYPTSAQIKTARKSAYNGRGCTASEAAQLVYIPSQQWRDMEAGTKLMHPALAELFAIKTGLTKIDTIPAVTDK